MSSCRDFEINLNSKIKPEEYQILKSEDFQKCNLDFEKLRIWSSKNFKKVKLIFENIQQGFSNEISTKFLKKSN